ncbi:MAG: hypothetical protein SGBAC_007441 [Bacillariaceae sp.]
MSKNQISGLSLEMLQGPNCLIVRKVMEGSLFAKTSLAPEMEIRVINGIDCSKLRETMEAYNIIKEAKRNVTIVARERVKEMDTPLSPIQPPQRQSAEAAADMWLEMVDYVHRRDTPQMIFPSKRELLLSPPKEEIKDEHIEAPPTPSFKRTTRPKTLPSNLELDNKISSHGSALSEITLNPSQHQTPMKPADIVITRPAGCFQKKSSIQSVLAGLYADYDSEDCDSDLQTSSSYSTDHVSLTRTATSLVREESLPRLPHGVDAPPPPPLLSGSAGSCRAGPMESHSLYAPSIPRVGAGDARFGQ